MSKRTSSPFDSRLLYYGATILLLLIFVGTRWYDLLHMPIFPDETTGLSRARDSLIGFPFQGLAHAKWLPTFIWAFFRPFGPESLWVIRGVNGLLAALTCASAVALGRYLQSRAAGLLAGLLYLTLPYAVFFERQALADPVLMAFGGLALVASLKLTHSRSGYWVPVTGVLIAAAALSKFSGLTLMVAPILAALVLAPTGHRRRALLRAALSVAFAIMTIGLVFLIADRYLRDYQSILSDNYNWGWLSRHANTATDSESLSSRLGHVTSRLTEVLGYFIGWPVVLLAGGSLVVLARRRDRRLLWMWLAGVLTVLPMLAIVTALPARYISFTIMPFIVLAASTLSFLLSEGHRRQWPRPLINGLAGLIVVGLVAHALPRSINLLLTPENANIPPYEGYQALVFPLDGLVDIHDALSDYADSSGLPVHVVYSGLSYLEISTYWGGHAGLLRSWEDTPDQQVEVANWLLAGEHVAYLDIVDSQGTISEEPHGNYTGTLGEFPAPGDAKFRLRVVTEPGPDMIRTMLNQVYGNPYGVAADYQVLATTLHEGQTLILHPGHQIDILRDETAGTDLTFIPLADRWPPDFEQADHLIAAGSPQVSSTRAIFFNETAGDPDRRIESLLNQRYFRVGEQWFGALRTVDYVTDVSDMRLVSQAPIFGDLIQLESSQVGAVSLDGRRLIAFDLLWTALQPVTPSYKVAVHVIDEADQIVAQHDGVPVGGLAPTHTWTSGEPITDRFAIDVPLGTWRLRLILYDAESGVRLPVNGSDSIILSEVTVPD